MALRGPLSMEGVSIRTAGNDPLRLKRERKDIDEKMWEAWGKRERETGRHHHLGSSRRLGMSVGVWVYGLGRCEGSCGVDEG